MPRIGIFTLDAATRRLTAGGTECHLTPKAFDLLLLLAREAPRVLPKSELHRRLWPDTFVSDATLTGLVKEVRQAFRKAGEERPLLRTVTRVGYALDTVADDTAGTETHPGAQHWLVYGLHHFVLVEGENLVGRKPPADVVVDHSSVSREHARITVRATEARIEDLASTNGTRVAGKRVVGPRVLASGDVIEFGTQSLVFRSTVGDGDTETQEMTGSSTPPSVRK